MFKNIANLIQSVPRSTRKRSRKLFTDFLTSINSDTINYDVEENTLSSVLRKRKQQRKQCQPTGKKN